jgi:hypothetical protein
VERARQITGDGPLGLRTCCESLVCKLLTSSILPLPQKRINALCLLPLSLRTEADYHHSPPPSWVQVHEREGESRLR